MKIIYLFIFLICSFTNVFGQLDTMFIRYDGSFVLVDTTRGFYNGETGAIWYGYEQEHYDKDGFKTSEVKYLDDSCFQRMERSWYKNGNPKLEVYVDYKEFYAYENYYNIDGILIRKDTFPGNRTYSTYFYYKNKQIERSIFFKNSKFECKNLRFIDSLNQIIWTEIDISKSPLRETPHSMIEYYEKGQIKGKGLLMKRDILAHTMENKLIFPWKFCKEGKWIYYNKDGTIKEVINYKNCMPE